MKVFLVVALLFICTWGKIPVIIDTDLGTDIDDTWAIAFLLKHPGVEIKLIVTDSHDTIARTKVLAKYLDLVGRTDIPIGIGINQDNKTGPADGALYPWAANFSLSDYPGTIFTDGVSAMVNVIQSSPSPVAVVAIAPCPSIQSALQLDSSIVDNSYIVAMGGSIYTGYSGKPPPSPEYNIVDELDASFALYNASWSIASAPLDVTELAQIGGNDYQMLLQSSDPIVTVLLENYRYWIDHCSWANTSCLIPPNPEEISSTLHDLVAATMVVDASFLHVEQLSILINSTGFTVISNEGRIVEEALKYNDIQGWKNFVTKVLLS